MFARALIVICLGVLTARAESPLAPVTIPGTIIVTAPGDVPEAAIDLFNKQAKETPVTVVLLGSKAKHPFPETKSIVELASTKSANDKTLLAPLGSAKAIWLWIDPTADPTPWIKETALGMILTGKRSAGVILGTNEPRLANQLGWLSGVRLTDEKGDAPQAGEVVLRLQPGSAIVASDRSIQIAGMGKVTAELAPSPTKPAYSEKYVPGAGWDLVQLRRAATTRAQTPAFPAKKPAEPVVPKGSLVIVGGGGAGPEIWKRFIELAGGPDKLIVVIPTAQEDSQVDRSPESRILSNVGAKNVKILHTRDRAKANDPEFSKMLLDAGGVWFGGGRQWRFVDAYEGTLTEERIRGVLQRGGAIGGSSAGASIQSEYMPRGHPLGNLEIAAEGYERGFGYLPGCAVDQHFFARKRTADMTKLMTLYPQYLGIGIDEGTAIVVQGSRADVIGKTKVAFYDYKSGKGPGEKEYDEVPSGKSYDLKTRKPINP